MNEYRRYILITMAALVAAVIVGAGLFWVFSGSSGRAPVREAAQPKKHAAAPAPRPHETIQQRVQEMQDGSLPVLESVLTIFGSREEAESEITGSMGMVALPESVATRIEQEESWGIAGDDGDQLDMYIHNIAGEPMTAILIRYSEGRCDEHDAAVLSWIAVYFGDPLPVDGAAMVHAAFPAPMDAPGYCAVVVGAYTGGTP